MAPQKKKQGFSPFHPDSGRHDRRPSFKPEEEEVEVAQIKVLQMWTAELFTRDGRRLIFRIDPPRKYYLKYRELLKNFSKWATLIVEDRPKENRPLEARIEA
jgi:hypothetical protein